MEERPDVSVLKTCIVMFCVTLLALIIATFFAACSVDYRKCLGKKADVGRVYGYANADLGKQLS